PSLGVERFPSQFAAFGQERHGVHKVLQGDDSDQLLFVDNRNDAEIARGELAESGGERLLFGGHVENAVHHSLHVAIAFGAQCFENLLPRHDANHVTAPYHWKIVLQRMRGLLERVFQSVGGRERGEVGEHDFFQADALQDGLKYRRALLQLCPGKKKKADHHQPIAVPSRLRATAEQHSNHDHQDGKDVADANGALGGLNHVDAARKKSAQNAAAIHGIRWQQVEQAEVKICPDNAPQQAARVEERLGGKRKAWNGRQQDKCGQTGDEKIHQRSGNRDSDITFPGVDRIRDGLCLVDYGDPADRQQDDALRRNARTAGYQSMPQFMQDHTAEKNTDQAENSKSGGRILSSGFGEKQKDQQKRKRQMNANF